MRMIPASCIAPLVFTALAAIAPGTADAGSTYIALGDSLAFGEYRFQGPSDGDRGYVAPYADYLARSNGGVRPQVINLAVDGETSTTFFNGGPLGTGPVPGQPNYAFNTHYLPPYPTQDNLLLTTIANQKAMGNTIGNITIQLGANDIFALTLDPSFFAKSLADQQTTALATLMTVQANYTNLLKQLKQQVPGATIVLLGYFDPFAPFAHDPTSPLFPIAQISAPAIQALNQIIQGEAAVFTMPYVDMYTPFLGHELAYTDVANPLIPGNVHPTPAGYAAMAAQLIPEPSGLVMGSTAALAGLGCAWRRRRKVAA